MHEYFVRWVIPPDLPAEDEDVYCWRADTKAREEREHTRALNEKWAAEKKQREYNEAWYAAQKAKECIETYEEHPWVLRIDQGSMRLCCGICDWPHPIQLSHGSDWTDLACVDFPVEVTYKSWRSSYWDNEYDEELDIRERKSEPKRRETSLDPLHRDGQDSGSEQGSSGTATG